MKHSFDLDNFESFLSEQADSHRMYANDRVWHNIQQSIHGIDRWPALTFASILTLSFLAVILTITYPNRQLIDDQPLMAQNQPKVVKMVDQNNNAHPENTVASTLTLMGQSMVQPISQSNREERISNKIKAETNYNSQISSDIELAGAEVEIQQTALEKPDREEKQSVLPQAGISEINKIQKARATALLVQVDEANTSITSTPETLTFNNAPIEKIADRHFIKTSMEYGPDLPAELNKKQSRWMLQFYATPSISYRYLLEDKKYVDDPSSINGPLAPYLTNSVNQFVRHKPKMGAEIGAAVLYQITDNLRVKSGLQLNYRQYGIEAYATATMQPALLTLNRGNGIDSVVRYTNISSQSGYKPIELSSNFLQLALPIGFDLRLAQANKLGFYVSASGQLTWQLASNSYIISADYKNYLKQPDLDRRFNINTAVEAFVSYEAGGITWQAGPQIRYQILPGSTKAYPVREHLVDYGLKVGIVKTIK